MTVDRPGSSSIAPRSEEITRLERRLELMYRFPDENPNPVLRMSDEGVLIYANASSAPITGQLGIALGDAVPEPLLSRLRAAAADPDRPSVELQCDRRTFALLPVPVADLGFTNLDGTDVTAVRVFARFPDRNPNPVFRVTPDGRLSYANQASQPIVRELGAAIGDPLEPTILGRIRDAATGRGPASLEIHAQGRVYSLLPVPVPEFDVINVYGTDITAEKVFARFPDRNPNPVFRVTPDGRLSYANDASQPIARALGVSVGDLVPDRERRLILAALSSEQRDGFEIEGEGRTFAIYPVNVPEFGLVNVYATDITAARAVEIAHRENERLLLNILPGAIAARLRAGEKVIADRIDDATLMFADIVNFTVMSSRMSPTDVVSLLNDVFITFDRLVDRYDLEKIKTIGDAYMVVGGLPGQPAEHVVRVAEMAMDLAAEVPRISSQPDLQFRVGIHTGPIVAGVIGAKKFIYDVWGDTVNIASRMESHGIPGRIQVTAAVHDRLAGRFAFEERGVIDVRGKGPMPTWFLLGRV